MSWSKNSYPKTIENRYEPAKVSFAERTSNYKSSMDLIYVDWTF